MFRKPLKNIEPGSQIWGPGKLRKKNFFWKISFGRRHGGFSERQKNAEISTFSTPIFWGFSPKFGGLFRVRDPPKSGFSDFRQNWGVDFSTISNDATFFGKTPDLKKFLRLLESFRRKLRTPNRKQNVFAITFSRGHASEIQWDPNPKWIVENDS